MIVGKNALWLVLGGLVTPAIIVTRAAKPWRRRAATTAPYDARALTASDAHDLFDG